MICTLATIKCYCTLCSNENTWTMDMVSMFLKLWYQSSFLLIHGEDVTDIFMIFNLLTRHGVLQTCIWNGGLWILAVSSAVLTKTGDDFSHSTHTNADFIPGLDQCHSLLNTFSFNAHYSYDVHTFIQHSAYEPHSTQTCPVLSISNNNLNFICFNNI